MSNNDLETCWSRWKHIFSRLPPAKILPKGLETIIYAKVHEHPDLFRQEHDSERSAPRTEKRTYEWLKKEVGRTVGLARMHRNYRELDECMKEVLQGALTPAKHLFSAEA